jgi:soluble lytic murein transglycosylase-like protein
MQKRTVRTLLFSSVLILLMLPSVASAEDVTAVPQPKLQVTVVNGKIVVTNAAPNPPLVLAEQTPATPTASTFDSRMPEEYHSLVHTISKDHGVDPNLVAAVMKVESNYDQRARSSAGALGLMQLIPETGRRFGVSDFFNPRQNIEGGVRYLKFLSDMFPGNIPLILAAYNSGENRVARLNRVPAIKETQDYVRKIQAIYKPSNGSAPVTATPAAPAPVVESAPAAAAPAPAPANTIYRTVDARGVVHFSNVAPPN